MKSFSQAGILAICFNLCILLINGRPQNDPGEPVATFEEIAALVHSEASEQLSEPEDTGIALDQIIAPAEDAGSDPEDAGNTNDHGYPRITPDPHIEKVAGNPVHGRSKVIEPAAGLYNKILNLAKGTDSKDGDPCSPDVEAKISSAIEMSISEPADPNEVSIILSEALALYQQEKAKKPEMTICNRSRLMMCDTARAKCACVPLTAHREMPQFKMKSSHCYSTQGSCNQDPMNMIPVFEQQKKAIWGHYGNPKTDLKRGCLQNLCVYLHEKNKMCEDRIPPTGKSAYATFTRIRINDDDKNYID